jgi:hypothetical protein
MDSIGPSRGYATVTMGRIESGIPVNVSMLSKYEKSAHFTNLKKARKIDPQFSGQQLDSMVYHFPETGIGVRNPCNVHLSAVINNIIYDRNTVLEYRRRIYIPC